MKSRIVIRADGGFQIGMGHVVRSLALAEMLKSDFEIIFAIQHPDESVLKTIQDSSTSVILLPATTDYIADASNFLHHIKSTDIVVLDGYGFKTDYQKAIKSKGCKLVCVDDLHAWHHVADGIINYAEGIEKTGYSAESYTQFYLGLNYVLIRKEFLEKKSLIRKINAVKRIFISFGASDVNNITNKFAEALIRIQGIEEINIMMGSINPHLKNIDDLIRKNKHVNIKSHVDISAKELRNLLLQCDVAICPASTISLECCAVGVGLVSGYTSENQLGILNSMEKNEAVINFENMNTLAHEEIKNSFEKLMKQPQVFNDLIEKQKIMIDGKSSERIVDIFKELSKKKLYFRFAVYEDVDLYFQWANDSLVRLNSYNQDQVKYEEHIKWFQSKLASKNCYLYLFLNEEKKPVGQVRIERNKGKAVIGISVDKAFRGRSYGIEMLKEASGDYFKKNPTSEIMAYIKIENTLSYKIFLKAGFNGEKIVDEQGYKSFRLSKKMSS